LHVIRKAARRASTLVLAAALAATAAGCGGSGGGDRIDPKALEHELQSVLSLQLTAAHFYERDVKVSCLGSGDDLHFSCHVDATRPSQPTQSWNLTVSCLPPGGRDEPRCFTDKGDALQ
jgi:hypothetical protein